MISNRLSRWTLAFFGCALINFIIAQALIVGGLTWPAVSWAAPNTLVAVHLLTLGWMLLLMLGALLQFVPVITSIMLPNQNLALVTLILIELGLLGMICGFLSLGSANAWLAHCLPVGGSLVIIGVLLAIYTIGVPLLRARPLPLPGRMVLVAMGFLLATITLGLLMALALTVPTTAAYFGPLLANGIGYHALAGLGGWFTICAIGVSYKLLPMFTLAPEARGIIGEIVHYLCACGFALALAAGVLAIGYPGTQWLQTAEFVGYIVAAVAVTVYLYDVVRIYKTRRRQSIELQNKTAVGAFVLLAIAAALTVALALTGQFQRHAPSLIFLVVFGWLSGLGVTQLYKIVPFLTWIGRFGKSLGRGPVPRVQDLVMEKRGVPWFILYFLGVAIATIATFAPWPNVVRIGIGLTGVATVMLTNEYWRAWRGYYADRQPQKTGRASTTPPFAGN